MLNVRGAVLATASMLLAMPAVAAPGADVYGAHDKVRDLHISPKGGFVASIANIKDQDAISISKVGGGICNIGNGGNNIRNIFWANEERLVVEISRTTKAPDDMRGGSQDELFVFAQAWSVGTDCKDVKMLEGHSFLSYLPDGHILMTVRSYNTAGGKAVNRGKADGLNRFRTDIYKVDPKSGDSQRFIRGEEATADWIVDDQGNPLLRIDFDPRADRWIVFHRPAADKSWQIAYDGRDAASNEDQIEFLDVGKVSGTALVRARNGSDHFGIYEYDLNQRRITRPLYVKSDADAGGLYYTDYSRAPHGVIWSEKDVISIQFTDKVSAQMDADLGATFGGEVANVVSSTKDGSKYLAYVEGATNPGGIYYFVDAQAGEISEIGRKKPGLTPKDVASVKFLTYAARDGLTIPAYLTLPYGSTGKNLPLVVLPHGGPDARDTDGFNGWTQFLASRGYAVLQPQFRGSAGFGKAFSEAGRFQWGLKMQDDVTDGVKHLIANGVADAKRICIMGWSYGGYSSLAGMTFSPELYKCGIAGAPVSDLPKMIEWVEKRQGRTMRPDDFWAKRIGMPFRDMERMVATSPARHASRVAAPILLVHGVNDTTVPIEQSDIMYKALKDAGKQVELVQISGDDHYLSQSSTGIQFLQRVEVFLAQHLK